MRILFLTNYFPPHYIGGYEQLCMDVADGLTARGHECHVLTSTYGVGKSVKEGNTYRYFELEQTAPLQFIDRYRKIRHNQDVLKHVITTVRPDITYIWNMGSLNWTLPRIAEKFSSRVAYFLSDPWIGNKYRIPRSNLFKILIDLRYVFQDLNLVSVACSCQYLKDELLQTGVPISDAGVIYNAVALEDYLGIDTSNQRKEGDLLYIGRLEERKGVHTVLRALGRIAGNRELRMTIVGTGEEKYLAKLKRIVNEFHLESSVTFAGQQPREALAGLLASHDIFVFPSEWEEPFSLTLIMALASGIPVVGTLTGGSKEILKPEINSLTYTPGDYDGLAVQIERLLADSGLSKNLATRARQDVQQFSLTKMIDSTEKFLLKACTEN